MTTFVLQGNVIRGHKVTCHYLLLLIYLFTDFIANFVITAYKLHGFNSHD